MSAPQKIPQKVLVCTAWPYVNGGPHIGHVAGNFLPADIFARFQRLAGREVILVSGSDSHGTPVTLQADKEGITPAEVITKYHPVWLQLFEGFGITFDLFTSTHTENHQQVVHDLFLRMKEGGYLTTEVSQQLYDRDGERFLPDRYVEGECPYCGHQEARGDQCDHCGKTYEAVELKNPVSKITGSRNVEARETEHFYLRLDLLNDALLAWISADKEHWRRPVLNFTKAELEKGELRGRAITRDLDWGITVPVDGFDDKRIYVWFEAVIGYLSATKEWAQLRGEPERWQEFWTASEGGEQARSYYFLGKDNVSFHTIMWPAILTGSGGLNLPYDVPANEFLNMYGSKFSKSRGIMIDAVDVVSRYQSDAWRYTLTALAPETSDTDFTWDDFLEKVNNELVANWGNLANRVLGFAFKRFDGQVPTPGDLDSADQALLAEIKDGASKVFSLYDGVHLKSALETTRALSQKVNQYLNDKAPWTTIKEDEKGAATSVFVALQCIHWLSILWAPILPASSQKIRNALGFPGEFFGTLSRQMVSDAFGEHEVLCYHPQEQNVTWEMSPLPPGQTMNKPEAPFAKLDPDQIKREGGEGELG